MGFSFHDSLGSFKEIVDGYGGWELAQVQYNYVDRDFQAGEAGIAYAAEREIGVVVMEPLRGGALARPPAELREIFARYRSPRLPYEWALRFALDRQEVVTVLSGMASADQILENAAVASSARPNAMTREELDLLEEARKIYKDREKVTCTTCGYCQPCPSGVAIPDVFNLYNTAVMFDAKADRSRWYDIGYVKEGKGADKCSRCGECLPKCPQHIAIPDMLEEGHAFLGGR
jgi:predicted aldo/keto reductase-like oxidoreductase